MPFHPVTGIYVQFFQYARLLILYRSQPFVDYWQWLPQNFRNGLLKNDISHWAGRVCGYLPQGFLPMGNQGTKMEGDNAQPGVVTAYRDVSHLFLMALFPEKSPLAPQSSKLPAWYYG